MWSPSNENYSCAFLICWNNYSSFRIHIKFVFHNVGGGSWNTGTATICEYQPLQWNSDSGCHKYSYRSVAEHCLTLTFLTYVTQLLSKSVSVKLSQIVSRSVSQSQLDCQDHITRTVRWFWFARRAEGSQRLRLDLDDYDYGNDDGRDNYCDNFNRVIEDNHMISWTHSVIEDDDDYFVQDYND